MMQRTPQRPPTQSTGVQASFSKMKSYEKVILVMGIILILLTAFLSQNYRQAQARNEKLSKQVLALERAANSLKKDFDLIALEKKKVDLTTELTGSKNPWYKSVESLDVDNLVSKSAVQTKVEIVKLNLAKPSKEKIGNVELIIETRHVEVKGELANSVRFIDQVERGPFTALRLDNIQITQVKGIWNGSFDIKLWYIAPQGGQ